MAEHRPLEPRPLGHSLVDLAVSPKAAIYWIAALLCTAGVYIASFGKMPIHPGFGDGPSIYIASAMSLAHGSGYRLIYYPQAPMAQLYPIGYPLLISPIFRLFPFGPTSILLAQLLNVVCIVVWADAARRLLLHAVDPLLAAGAALAMALTPLALEMGAQVKADIVFGAIAILALAIAIADDAHASTRRRLLRGALIGVLAACAMLVRTIGFTIIFGLALEMLLNRRWLRLFGFAAATTLVLAPWLLWSFLHYGGTFRAYTSENVITWKTPISHFWLLAAQTAPSMLFAPLDRFAYSGIGVRLHLAVLTNLCGLIIAALVILGWGRLLLRRHLVALVIAPYMAIVFFWWFEPTRFVIPVLPLIVYCAAEGAQVVLRTAISIPLRRVAFTLAVVSILGGMAADAVKVERAWRCGNTEGPEAAAEWSQMHRGLNWISQNTPPDAVVFSSYPAGVYLFTSRHTLDLNNGTHIGDKFTPTNSMDLDAAFRNASVYPSEYVFATYRYDYIVKQEWGLTPVQRFIAAHPGRLELKWASDNGLFFVYKVIN